MADIKDVMEEIYSDINNGDLNCFSSHMAPDFVEHEDVPGGAVGADGVRQWFQSTIDAFPDLRMDPQDVIVADDRAVARVRMHGTHTGKDFVGIPASGRSFDFELIDIMRFDGDKIAEHWGVSDTMKLMQQLGVVPDMA